MGPKPAAPLTMSEPDLIRYVGLKPQGGQAAILDTEALRQIQWLIVNCRWIGKHTRFIAQPMRRSIVTSFSSNRYGTTGFMPVSFPRTIPDVHNDKRKEMDSDKTKCRHNSSTYPDYYFWLNAILRLYFEKKK